MSDLDEEFARSLEIINTRKSKYSESEQNIIESWLSKLSEPKVTDREKIVRNQYARALAEIVSKGQQIWKPFTATPPEGDLPPLPDRATPVSNKVAPLVDQEMPLSEPEIPSSGPEMPLSDTEMPLSDTETPLSDTATPLSESATPLSESQSSKQQKSSRSSSFQIKKMPCPKSVNFQGPKTSGTKPKTKKTDKSVLQFDPLAVNEFEDPEEMAKAVARSKGQTFADFVLSVSRHTADFGQGLYSAMKTETNIFKDYVDNVLSQRIKDLTEVLNEEQNRELIRIKKDIERWQTELSNVKKRIREIIPDFDLDAYRKDRNYLNKLFTIQTKWHPEDNSFDKWKEENCHRLKWFSDMICNVSHSNEQTTQKIADIKCEALDLEARETIRQQNQIKQLNCELNEYQRLKLERDKLHKEYTELLSQLQEEY